MNSPTRTKAELIVFAHQSMLQLILALKAAGYHVNAVKDGNLHITPSTGQEAIMEKRTLERLVERCDAVYLSVNENTTYRLSLTNWLEEIQTTRRMEIDPSDLEKITAVNTLVELEFYPAKSPAYVLYKASLSDALDAAHRIIDSIQSLRP